MLKALIVDDIALIRTSLSQKIEEIGGCVRVAATAGNGKEALEWLEHHYADICITDVRMPIIDGMELIRILTERFPWMSFIVVSNYDDFEYVQNSLKLDAIDFILKPIIIPTLREALAKAETRMKRDRVRQASELLLRRMVSEKELIKRWLDDLNNRRFVTLPVLIHDTLETFERWTEQRFYLLEALAEAWLHWLVVELRGEEGPDIEIREAEPFYFDPDAARYKEMHRYYRLCAVKKLEEFGISLIDALRLRKGDAAYQLVDQIKTFIHQSFAEKITLEQISDHVAYSKYYIANIFKRETGMTIWEYLNYVRVTEAQKLMVDGALRINEIADRVGVANAVHFNRIFKDYYGVSPLEYRKRILSL